MFRAASCNRFAFQVDFDLKISTAMRPTQKIKIDT